MSEESHKTIWLSGSESYPAQATQCQAVLDAIGVRVASGHVLKPGEHAAEQTAAEIESAAGIIILLGPKWTTQTDPKEVACIEAQCSQKASLWIIYIAATLDPPVLQKLLVLARQTQRLPRSGNALTQLSAPKRHAVLEELARSVSAQLGLPLPHDGQYRQIQDYRRTRVGQLEFVPLRGFFGAQHVDRARAFRFADLFVSPRLEWLREPASIAEQYRRLSAQIEDQRLSAQERWDLEMQRSALASRYGQGAVAKLEEILHRHPQIMLLGKPGSGKSTILHSLELQAHRCDAELAIQIKLQSIAERAGHGESLWPQVLQKIRSEHGSVVAEAFEEWADQGRALLLLDGVDEVQAEHRAKLLSTVEKMLLGRQKLRCVVTSRLANDCWLNAQISHLQVADFNPDEIAAFVRKHKHCEDQATAEGRAEHLVTVIQASSELQELAHNPLLLRLLCLLDQGDDGLPRDLVTVYEYAIHTLLETWPANRVARRVRVSPAELRNALASTAAWMHVRGCREADRADLLQQLAKALPSAKAQTAEKLAAYCLNVATEHAGILVEVSPNKFEFLHLTFTEYLAADHYVRQNKLPFLAAQRGDSRYAQVIRFAAGILSHVHRRESDATEFLRALMAEPPGSTDQIRHPHLPLAAECLGDGSRFPPDLVDDLLAYLLRAATVPLRSLTASVERTLDALRFPASAKVIAATAALLHHPLNSLRLAVARFLARNTINRPDAQALCLELLGDQNTAIACHAALGLLRAGSIPETHRTEITVRLSYAFASKIAAADELKQALRRLPQIAQVAEEQYSIDHPRYQVEAARILSLLRPGDWTLLRLLLEKGRDENERAVAYAALRSEDSAERIVDTFLGNEQSSTYGPSALASVLHAIFPDSTSVRRRFLFHYKRPLPETASSSEKNTLERRSTEAAAAYFHDLTRAGEAKARHRAALLPDLHQLLHDADTDLCRRIATLGGELRAPSDWLRDAITPCMQAGGIYRVWAINFAFEQKLYDLAVAGTLARAETLDCQAAAIGELLRGTRRLSNELDPILSVIEQQPASSLRDNLLLLCQIKSGRESLQKLYPLLESSIDDVPMALRWWAASEIVFWSQRGAEKPPVQLSGVILALTVATWPSPPDMTVHGGTRRSNWIPRHHPDFPPGLQANSIPFPPASSKEAEEAVRTSLRWMNRLIEEGATANIRGSGFLSAWLRATVCAHIPLLDEIIYGLADHNKQVCCVSAAFMEAICEHKMERQIDPAPPSTSRSAEREVILQRVLAALGQGSTQLRLKFISFFRERAVDRALTLPALDCLLSSENDLSVRWAALCHLRDDDITSIADARAVLRDALAAEDPELRLAAAKRATRLAAMDLDFSSALRPLLSPSVQPNLGLQAVAIWLLSPATDRTAVLPVLHALLACPDAPSRRAMHAAEEALHQVCRVDRENTLQHPVDRLLEPRNENTRIGFWAAAFLVELGGSVEALRSAASAWLMALPENVANVQPWHEQRALALGLLHRIGVGRTWAALDQVLVNMLVHDELYELLCWSEKFGHISRPMIEHLVPRMLDAHDSTGTILGARVIACAQQDHSVRLDLESALVSALRQRQAKTSDQAAELLRLLIQFDLIDEDAADLFVETASQRVLGRMATDRSLVEVIHHPIVLKRTLAALHTCTSWEWVALVDRLVPYHPGLADDDPQPSSLSEEVVQELRAWLLHPDYGLRFEAAEHLYRGGHRDEEIVASLRSCLNTPLDWNDLYSGTGARFAAAELLIKLGVHRPSELLDSLLPILSKPVALYDFKALCERLASVEECRRPALEAVRTSLLGANRKHRSKWEVVQEFCRLGPSDDERIDLLLESLTDEPYVLTEVGRALSSLLGLDPARSLEEPEDFAAAKSVTDRDRVFRRGPLRGAAILATLSKWPPLLLKSLAEALSCSVDTLSALDGEGSLLAQPALVALLSLLVHHDARDSSATRLVRYACLLRFGPLVGISLEQLPYELIN